MLQRAGSSAFFGSHRRTAWRVPVGSLTTLVGMPALEHVLTGTLLTFRQREGLLKAVESQSLTGKEARVRHVC